MSLSDILDQLQAEEPEAHSRVKQEPGVGPWGIMEHNHKWSPQDHEQAILLPLSRYEAYWLWWRMIVHLRTYEGMEWSEMKEVLGCLTKRIQSLSTRKTLCAADASTPAEALSEPVGIQIKPLHPSDVATTSVEPMLVMENMENSTGLKETF